MKELLQVGDKIWTTQKYSSRVGGIATIIGETKTQFKCESRSKKFNIKKDSGYEIGLSGWDRSHWSKITPEISEKIKIQSLENNVRDILNNIHENGLWKIITVSNIPESNLNILLSEAGKFLNILKSFEKPKDKP